MLAANGWRGQLLAALTVGGRSDRRAVGPAAVGVQINVLPPIDTGRNDTLQGWLYRIPTARPPGLTQETTTMNTADIAARLAAYINRHNAGSYARLPAAGRDWLVAHILAEAGVGQGEHRFVHNALKGA